MEHQALAAATAAAIHAWISARCRSAPPVRMVDLGCGDLAQLAPLLRSLPLAAYTGVDLCADVLPLAAARLEAAGYPCTWSQQDLLAWVLNPQGRDQAPVDLVHSAYAVHHLSDGSKQQLLDGLRSRLAPAGMVLWADVFLEPGESRDHYLGRYGRRILQGWDPLSPVERGQVIEHITAHDFPADGQAIQRFAEASGWRWQWLWRGSHRAEALAMLTPSG